MPTSMQKTDTFPGVKTVEKSRYTMHRLEAHQRPKYLYEYYVSGRGEFPLDMLRYDSAWPVDGTNAAKMESALAGGPRGLRSIKLRSYREPTLGRWSSFLWSVGTQNLEELK